MKYIKKLLLWDSEWAEGVDQAFTFAIGAGVIGWGIVGLLALFRFILDPENSLTVVLAFSIGIPAYLVIQLIVSLYKYNKKHKKGNTSSFARKNTKIS